VRVPSFTLVAVALVSCAVERPAETHLDAHGWLVVACPGEPEACVEEVARRCQGRPYLLANQNDEARTLVTPPEPAERARARVVANDDLLRSRCVDTLMTDSK
jgi:hypothetical protein